MYGISLAKCEDKLFLQVFMEYCEDSLYNIVMKNQRPVPCANFSRLADCTNSWTFVTSIMRGLCSALGYIHSAGFIHRDLKLANILVKGDDSVRLADFGLRKKEESSTETNVSTRLCMAPEVLRGDLYGSEADIYSLGMVLYELWYYRPVFTRPLPYNPDQFEFIIQPFNNLEDSIVSKGFRPDYEISHKPPNELTAVMKMCWDANAEERPTAAEVYKHMCQFNFT